MVNQMLKFLSFLLTTSIFFVTEPSAMPNDRTEKARARLRKKQVEKDPRVIEEKKIIEKKKKQLDAVDTTQQLIAQCDTAFTAPSKLNEKFIAIFTDSLKHVEVTEQKFSEIHKAFSLRKLDITQTLTIREGLINSLTSGQKYKENIHNRLCEERNFYLSRNKSFDNSQAFACDVLPFNHKSRKDFVAHFYTASLADRKVLPIYIDLWNEMDTQSTIFLTSFYVSLFSFSNTIIDVVAAMQPQLDHEKDLRIKYRRLVSSLCYGDLESVLKCSNLMRPYIEIIQNVLKIKGLDDIFTFEKILEDILDKQRIENQRGPVLLTRYKLFLQERAKKNRQVSPIELAALPIEIKIESLSQNQLTLPEECIKENHSPVHTNEKSKYRGLSEQEMIAERKRQGKEQKKVNAGMSSLKEPELKSLSAKEGKPSVKIDSLIQIGGGPFKIFNKIMDQSFRGTIEKIVLLIEALGGSVDDGRSGSRIKIELPYINSNTKAYLDLLPPEEEDENKVPHSQPITRTNTTTPISTAESVMHAPHKGKSNKLRFYHTKDVRELLMDAGYTPDTVLKAGSQK